MIIIITLRDDQVLKAALQFSYFDDSVTRSEIYYYQYSFSKFAIRIDSKEQRQGKTFL